LTLACLSAMGVFLLLRHPPGAGEALPFLAVVRRLGPPWSIAYQAVLLAALVTTALSSQVALQQRLRLSSPLAAPLPLLVAVPLAFLGLPWIVRRLYPLAGAASLAILVFLLWPKRS
ncbi:MAG: hypothetical protein QJR00_02780, partial [Bacillota bacterium]|nr:hypothetical protein [Bacillota bacterium]